MKKKKHRKIIYITGIAVIAAILLIIFIPKVMAAKAPDGLERYLIPIEEIQIPEQVRVVGLGEATHGNREFWDVRQTALSALVQYDFNVVVLEADFGGCLAANEYVVNGTGSAHDAARALGFAVYRTEEVAGFLEWIRDYNEKAGSEQAIHFMGCDMQRYDNNKEILFDYLRMVIPEKVSEYEQELSDLNDETVFNQDQELIVQGLNAVQALLEDMEKNREVYAAATSAAEYDLAYACGNSIRENAVLRGTNVNYGSTRDEYMAEKLRWIDLYESAGRETRLLLLGHNGHVEKTSASGYRCLGEHLNELYGAEYFAIGTEYSESTFLSKDTSGSRKEFHVLNGNSSRLSTVLGKVTEGPVYLDFAVCKEDPEMESLLGKSVRMSNIGDEFNRLLGLLPQFRTLKMIPNEAYDALIYIKKVTPTTMIY